MSKRTLQKATGEDSQYVLDPKGIDRVLSELRGVSHGVGFGREVSTVGRLDEIMTLLEDGWEILWCQMAKTDKEVHSGKTSTTG